MKFDKPAKVMVAQPVPDGMGGWLPAQPVEVSALYTFTTPVKAELLLKEYGIVSTTSLKVFTKGTIPQEDEAGNRLTPYLQFEDGKEYRILQLADFGKIRMALVELMA